MAARKTSGTSSASVTEMAPSPVDEARRFSASINSPETPAAGIGTARGRSILPLMLRGFTRWYQMHVSLTVLFVSVGFIEATLSGMTAPGLALWAWALLLLAPVSLIWTQRYPRTIVIVNVALFAPLAHLDLAPFAYVPLLLAVGMSIYKGYRGFAFISVTFLSAATAVSYAAAHDFNYTLDVWRQALLIIGWLHVALVAGESFRQRDVVAAEADSKRVETIKRMASDERLRIARELHDSLTHSIAVIKVQSGVAIHLARKEGREIDDTLTAISQAATAATAELRSTVESLREEDGHKTVNDVPQLLDQYRTHGLTIEFEGILSAESPGEHAKQFGHSDSYISLVAHATYRIVQEALTNTARHSNSAEVYIRMNYESATEIATFAVLDNGHLDHYTPGHGLTGIAERVAILGGDFYTGPRQGKTGLHSGSSVPAWVRSHLANSSFDGFVVAVRFTCPASER